MEQGKQARVALEDIRRRQEAVSRELDRNRPTWWMDLLFAVGFYLVPAGTELGPAIALSMAACGFGLLALSVGLGIRRAARGGVGGPRRIFTAGRIAAAAVWLVGLLALFRLALAVVEGYTPEWAAPFFAAVPAAVLSWFFVRWIGRISVGPRPGSGRAE